MPSQKVLESKQQFVEELAEKIKGSACGVLVDYKGINVADDTMLRKSLREAGVEYFVVKNTLLKRAAEKAGIEGLDAHLEGTTALAPSRQSCPTRILLLQSSFSFSSLLSRSLLSPQARLRRKTKARQRPLLKFSGCITQNFKYGGT